MTKDLGVGYTQVGYQLLNTWIRWGRGIEAVSL